MKKILFNDKFALTQAVLDGRKTQTRRIAYDFRKHTSNKVDKCVLLDNGNITYMDGEVQVLDELLRPQYKLGEVIAVAQKYSDFMVPDKILYRTVKEVDGYRKELASEQKGWSNKLFVCANLLPHRIRITNVRVERLQDISDEDCLAEGVVKGRVGSADTHYMDAYYPSACSMKEPCCTPREAYAALIDKISGKGTWESNPYVFVYDFELVKSTME